MSDEDAVKRGIENAFSWTAMRAGELVTMLECELMRPSVLFRPHLAKDGDAWSVLYGDNIQEGVCGFGDSPDAAMRDFDQHWTDKIAQTLPDQP
jgi:hypothetical protein